MERVRARDPATPVGSLALGGVGWQRSDVGQGGRGVSGGRGLPLPLTLQGGSAASRQPGEGEL
jgi:hypothetical protein